MQSLDQHDLDVIIQSNPVVLVDFTAVWCNPCRILKPLLEKLEAFHDKTPFITVDVDAHPDLSARFGVTSMPTVMIFKDGQLVQTIVGLNPEKIYAEALTVAED